jgi:acetyl esterase/lipase
LPLLLLWALPAWGGAAGQTPGAVPDTVKIVTDVVYAVAPDRAGDPVELTFDAAFPRQSDGKKLPAVIYIHGGGFRGGRKEAGREFILAFAEGGYLAVSIDYRLSGQAPFPAAVHDAKAAVRFLRSHAEELGIDPERIGVWGHSAGAALAAIIAVSGNDRALEGEVAPGGCSSEVRCLVELSGPIDFTRFERANALEPLQAWLGKGRETYERNARAASPLAYLDEHDPPTMIVHGTDDPLVPIEQGDLFAEALEKAGVRVEYVRVEGGGHGIREPFAYKRIAEFFDEHLGGQVARIERLTTARQKRDDRVRRPDD